MSTSPEDSPDAPRDPGGRRGAAMPGSSTGRPSGPPMAGSAVPESGGQLGEDAKQVAAEALMGAVTGGYAGAAKGAALAAVKSKTGRKVIGGVVAGALAMAFVFIAAFAGGGSGVGGVSPEQVYALDSAEHAAQAYAVASSEYEDPEILDTLRVAASRSGARWEVLAAIYSNIDARSGNKGTGPMGIDKDKIPDDEPISDEDIASLEASAYYIGGLLTPALYEAEPDLNSFELDNGYSDSEDGLEEETPEEGTEESGKAEESEEEEFRVGVPAEKEDSEDGDKAKEDSGDEPEETAPVMRTAIDTEEAKALRAEIKEAYITAIASLPLEPNPDMAEEVFDTALAWSVGKVAAPQSQCGSADGGDVELGGQTDVDLNDSQLKYAQAIINRAASRGMPQNAAVVALATAMQESKLRMYWNVRVPGSKELTDDKDAAGSDGYSVGLFQQQVNGTMYSWGTVEEAMNPAKSTDMFLDRLLTIPGWEALNVSEAAQRVQVSAYPDAYAQWEKMARQLVNDLKPTQGSWKDSHAKGNVKALAAEPASFTVKTEKKEDGKDEKAAKDELKLPAHLKVNPAITADAQATEMAVGTRFGDVISTWGDYRNSSDDHGQKRAIDLMIKDYKSPAGIKGGTGISDFLIANAEALGVEYIIWRDKIWLGQATGWKPYSTGGYGSMYAGNWDDTTLHNDHVHVTVYGNKGTGGEFKYTSPEGETSPCGGNTGTGVGTGVGAGSGDDYPFKSPVGKCAWCSGGDNVDPWGMYKRECVSFVSWRMNQQMGWKEGQPYPFTKASKGTGNAAIWSSALAGHGYVTDNNPAVGAIAWWAANVNNGDIITGEAGHVAVVKEVLADGRIVVEQYNGPGSEWAYSTQTMHKSKVTGFIHVADVPTKKAKDVKAVE